MRFRIITLLCALSMISGCAPMVIGGAAATGGAVAIDPRTVGTMLDDESIELKIQQQIVADPELLENTHVNVTSYNGVVLLTGEAFFPLHKQRVEEIARQQRKVREIRNALRIGPVSAASSRSRDTRITARVKAQLIEADTINASRIKVVTENSMVYLMGMVSREEADRAVDVVRTGKGVARIVKVFEYTN
ncbi:MAG: BON domain-containing protein [Pseudomonadota bacterium]